MKPTQAQLGSRSSKVEAPSKLVPTLEDYVHLLGIPVSDKVPFNGLEEIPRSHIIAEALHLKKYEIGAHLVKKGGIMGFTFELLIGKATIFSQAGSVDYFEAIFVLLICGLALFPNIDGFVDVNAIRIFLIGNPVPTLLGDMYFYLHLRNSKGGGTIVCCVPLLYKWFIWHLPQTPAFLENKQCPSLDIIDNCGEFSKVPLIGTQGGINYNLTLAHRQLGFPLRDKPNNTQLKGRSELGPCNYVTLEAYTIWVKKRALKLKMSYACERPMSLVVVEPSTLPNQDVEGLEDAFAKMKQDIDIKLSQPSGAWKKIVGQLVLEKAHMKTTFEFKIRRIRRKYAPIARSSDAIAKGSL
ncbi:hypothetical protein KIW84_022455 [Lathyrus oleraceus]|uniref:DUF7745 domain-containing protein n=1 Tax=Pisum sativum TaxID=3888 RepID=A0A9D5B9Z5_PEA|nr:hypothetical protein KIW84_022455 [Pisum sativum]